MNEQELKNKYYAESISRQIESAKELVKKGEITKESYPFFLALTFQRELESLLGVKFDTGLIRG